MSSESEQVTQKSEMQFEISNISGHAKNFCTPMVPTVNLDRQASAVEQVNLGKLLLMLSENVEMEMEFILY